jgi:hypothetical protein
MLKYRNSKSFGIAKPIVRVERLLRCRFDFDRTQLSFLCWLLSLFMNLRIIVVGEGRVAARITTARQGIEARQGARNNQTTKQKIQAH